MVLHGMPEFHKEPGSSKTSYPCGPRLPELVRPLEQESFSGLPSSVSHGEAQLAGAGREAPCRPKLCSSVGKRIWIEGRCLVSELTRVGMSLLRTPESWVSLWEPGTEHLVLINI